MKKQLLLFSTLLVAFYGTAQNTFPATGNVGIGTTSPLKLLHVKGAGAFGNQVSSTNAPRALNLADAEAVMRILRVHTTNAPAVELISRTSANGANVAYWDLYAEPSDKSFRIRDRVTGSNLDRLTIKNNGRVGIGTTNPAAQLHIQGNGNNVLLGQWAPNSNYSGLSMNGSLAEANYNILSGNGDKNLYLNRPPGHSMEFRMGNASQMSLSADGYLGIGAFPSYPLHVNGVIYSTSGIYGSPLSGTVSSGSGVYGSSGSGYGVEAYSGSTIGVYGQSNASFSAGMYAVSPYIGIQGVSSGTDAARQAVRGENYGSSTGYAGYFHGNVWVYGTLIKNAGSFKIDHPLDPANKYLSHSFVESPDMKNIYDGVVTTDPSGKATVTLPAYFEALNKDFRYQLTPIGSFAQTIVSKEISNNQFEVQTSESGVRVSWQVTGIRKDAYAEKHRIPVEEPKTGNEIGKYIFPAGFGGTEADNLDIARPRDDKSGRFDESPLYAQSPVGSEVAAASYLPSDRGLKQNINDLAAAMPVINKLQPKEFEFRQDGLYKMMNLPTGKQYGLIAQEVEGVLPALVKQNEFQTGRIPPAGVDPKGTALASRLTKEESNGPISYKAVNYTELVPIIVKALQELSNENEELRKKADRVDALEARLQKLEALQNAGAHRNGGISDAYLEQAAPNPAKGATLIRYGLPDGTSSARLTLANAKGQVLKEVRLTSRGTGQVSLNTEALPSGTYTYTLWVGGKQASSKQLVVTR